MARKKRARTAAKVATKSLTNGKKTRSKKKSPAKRRAKKTSGAGTKARRASSKVAGIGGEAVKAKTGRDWNQWLKVLDKHGARSLPHRQIVAILKDEYGIDPWWRQMITVGYEQARGLRKKHQRPGGYQVSASKTVRAPIDAAFAAFEQADERTRWLETPAADGTFEIRKATPGKSLRVTWVDGLTHVEVYLYDKGGEKSQVVVQHSKLRTKKAAEQHKRYWRAQLGNLKEMLEADR